MMIMGVDYHPSFQQITFLDQETGECGERRLNHSDGEAEQFYRDLKQRGVSVRVGMEETQASEQTIMALTGHLSRRMVEHYSPIRMEAKRAALDAIAASTSHVAVHQKAQRANRAWSLSR
jgi:hypothetical protein